MPAPKNSLTQLNYDQCVDILRQFDEKYPQAKKAPEFLGLSVGVEQGAAVVKVTVKQLGEANFVKNAKLPKEMEIKLGTKKSQARILIKAAPVLTSAAPKSSQKKSAPVFPPGVSGSH